MSNPYRGDVVLEGVGTLRFTWGRLAALKAEFGADWDKSLSAAMAQTDTDTIARAIAIGAGVEKAAVEEASPPVTVAVEALLAALNVAFYGDKESPEAPGENPSGT